MVHLPLRFSRNPPPLSPVHGPKPFFSPEGKNKTFQSGYNVVSGRSPKKEKEKEACVSAEM